MSVPHLSQPFSTLTTGAGPSHRHSLRHSLCATILVLLIPVSAFSDTSSETLDSFPQDCSAEAHSVGHAAVGGRPIQVRLSVLRRVAPPSPAADVRQNWPAVPGLQLRVRTGFLRDDGRLEADPAAGFVSMQSGMTSAAGTLDVDYLPPTTGLSNPMPVAVWFEDRDGRAVVAPINLWQPATASASAPARLRMTQPDHWIYSNEVSQEPLRSMIETEITRWNQAIQRTAPELGIQVFQPYRPGGPAVNLRITANYPNSAEDRLRTAYGVTSLAATGKGLVRFHLERLFPRPALQPFTPGRASGLENVARTFEPALPEEAVAGTVAHELGHVLGLDDTESPDTEGSIMSQGRGSQIGNQFRFFVNGVSSASETDIAEVVALRRARQASRSLARSTRDM